MNKYSLHGWNITTTSTNGRGLTWSTLGEDFWDSRLLEYIFPKHSSPWFSFRPRHVTLDWPKETKPKAGQVSMLECFMGSIFYNHGRPWSLAWCYKAHDWHHPWCPSWMWHPLCQMMESLAPGVLGYYTFVHKFWITCNIELYLGLG